MLRATGIRKIFRSTEVLNAAEFSVSPGEIVVVIGPSGGGKTTLLRAVSLIDPPTSGIVEVDGEKYSFPSRSTPRSPWPRLTVVFQQFFLWPHLTIRQNIELPLQLRGVTDRAYVSGLIEEFQMADVVHRYPNAVSTGERQRAAFVRAVALRPRYLLLDEITAAQDVERVALILRKVQALKADGVGVVIVTHALSFARRAADGVYFVDAGTVNREGDRTVLDNPSRPRFRQFLAEVDQSR